MITEIQMNGVASFTSESRLTTDKKINLIYGLNGAGKSTISEFLLSPKLQKFSSCRITPTQSTSTLVYNQKFIQENFYLADTLKGIFSLSKENKAAEEQIQKAEANLVKARQKLQDHHISKSLVSSAFEAQKQRALDAVWSIKTMYSGGDRVLEYCLEGLKGQKDKLFEHLRKIPKPAAEPKKTIKTLRGEVETLGDGNNNNTHRKLQRLEFTAAAIELDPLLGTAILGNSDSEIASLIDALGNADWVKQGLAYIPTQEKDEIEQCPFCQEETITSKFRIAVSKYFDNTYESQLAKIREHRKAYVAAIPSLTDISSHTTHMLAASRRDSLMVKHATLLRILQENARTLEGKINNPKLPVVLVNSSSALDAYNAEIDALNDEVEIHNERQRNRDATLRALKNEFWEIMRWQYDQSITRFEQDLFSANKQTEELDKEIQNVGTNIITIEAELKGAQAATVNIDDAIDAINSGLLELGIDGFKIVRHSKSLYRVARAENVENAFLSLSEGEKMVISFLYFRELCRGKSTIDEVATDRIAVIDDPISSLSHIFVFNVGQMIKADFFRSSKFSQVFILTHSLYFFYELTDPNHDRRKDSQKLFRLSKSSKGSAIVEMKYEEIQNDYQSYWSIINDQTQPAALIANCMRNIIEYFFGFVRKRDLNNVFLLPELQTNKFQAFCRYINRESHSFGQNILDTKEFDYAVFKEGLRLVFDKTGYSEHFLAMSRL